MDKRAIFILGVAPRSGTNFLTDLLKLHDQAGACTSIAEDYLSHYSAGLDNYARQVTAHWNTNRDIWNTRMAEHPEDQILAALGNGLMGYLSKFCDEPVIVSKTPSPTNPDLALRLFPQAKLLMLVRDGRAVVESSVRSKLGTSHGHRYDVFTHQWANGAETIINFCAAFAGESSRVRLVRYEDLIENFDTEFRAIVDFCELDASGIDFAAAANLPVRGSSTFGQIAGEQALHASRLGGHLDWRPKPRTEEFNPLQRWADWPAQRHAMFNRVAGRYMQALGYCLIEP